eukprot:CAMPEP_0119048660 /NCGR_PEP_ID=MMETSP1177-20130426/60275_1 /TAXON_ID=2985 /ORGANISM="Ochromonas sp, Strain CCMP1899" /LENGTH=85 /DNA_ID=CAMNT_0007024867 /DNA_START=832 /DNA_END=1085 /DNA_ORIENTATION=-
MPIKDEPITTISLENSTQNSPSIINILEEKVEKDVSFFDDEISVELGKDITDKLDTDKPDMEISPSDDSLQSGDDIHSSNAHIPP